jgi:hypothetical protein
MESFQIHLNSSNADKINNNNNCDVEFYLPVIEIPSQCHIYVSVQHAVIPYTFYNINSSNNILKYSISGTIYTVVITPGNYNVYTLQTFLQSNMTNFTISYNPVTNAFTFTNSITNFTILSSSTCLPLIGFLAQDNISTTFALVSNRAVNLAQIRCICVNSNLKTNNINKSTLNNFSTICSIPVSVAPYSIVSFANHNNFRVNTFTSTISTIAIKLCDQNGNLIDLNGSNWALTLQFDVVDFVE